MIDTLIAEVPGITDRFRLLFSAGPFPGSQGELIRDREEDGGHWYSMAELQMEGWLCPALFKYFDEAPAKLYFKVEAIDEV